jgi:hypothetical protein
MYIYVYMYVYIYVFVCLVLKFECLSKSPAHSRTTREKNKWSHKNTDAQKN